MASLKKISLGFIIVLNWTKNTSLILIGLKQHAFYKHSRCICIDVFGIKYCPVSFLLFCATDKLTVLASPCRDTNLYVGNIPPGITEEDLVNLFAPYGNVLTRNLLKAPCNQHLCSVADPN